MVQIVLYVGLGFLSALLLVLILSPFLRRRTIRLTERRMRAELPQSMEEIRAERDSVRADYAMRVRQLEIKQDKLKDAAVERTLLMEGRNEEISTLKTEIREKNDIIAETSDELDGARNTSRDREEELARAKSKIRDLVTRLERKIKELERSEARSDELDVTVEKQRAELIEGRASLRNVERYGLPVGHVPADDDADKAGKTEAEDEIRPDPPMSTRPRDDLMFEDRLDVTEGSAALRIEVTELEAAKFAAEMRAQKTQDQLASAEDKVIGLQEKLMRLQSLDEPDPSSGTASGDEESKTRIFDLEEQISDLESGLAAKEARIAILVRDAELSSPGAGDDDTVIALRSKLLDVEAEKAAFESEVTRLTLDLEMAHSLDGPGNTGPDPEIEKVRGNLRTAEEALITAQSDRDQALAKADMLDQELKKLEALQGSQSKIEQAEVSILRDSLSDLAADVTHMVMTLEGEASPVNEILASSNGKTAANGTSSDIISLADRIKTLRDRATSQLSN